MTDNQILNNSYYDPTGSATFARTEEGVPDGDGLRYPDNTTVRNNLLYAPNGSVTVFSAVDDEGAGTSHAVEANLDAAANPFVASNPATNPVDSTDYRLIYSIRGPQPTLF